jgi:hypothetical protein
MMAGLPSAISSVLYDDILTFLNRACKVHLEPLNLEDIRVYYAQTFARLKSASMPRLWTRWFARPVAIPIWGSTCAESCDAEPVPMTPFQNRHLTSVCCALPSV